MEGVPLGHATATFDITSTNAAQALTAAELFGSDGVSRPIGALISARANDIKFAIAADPVSAGLGHLLDVSADSSVTLLSGTQVKNFRFISAVAGAHGVLSTTIFFESGKGD